MILKSVTLKDFRSYRGTQILDLSACTLGSDRNIVAIGGLNGAGKTSLLEAVTFALLGVVKAYKFIEDIERKGNGRDQIDRALNGLLNRQAREAGEQEVAVTLVFVDEDGKTFSVRRTWLFDSRGRFK